MRLFDTYDIDRVVDLSITKVRVTKYCRGNVKISLWKPTFNEWLDLEISTDTPQNWEALLEVLANLRK